MAVRTSPRKATNVSYIMERLGMDGKSPESRDPTYAMLRAARRRKFAELQSLIQACTRAQVTLALKYTCTSIGGCGRTKTFISYAAHKADLGDILQIASRLGEVDLVHLLLQHGADPNTPGMIKEVFKGGSTEVAQILLDAGMQVDPWHMFRAITAKQQEIARMFWPLWQHDKERCKDTPLHQAKYMAWKGVVCAIEAGYGMNSSSMDALCMVAAECTVAEQQKSM